MKQRSQPKRQNIQPVSHGGIDELLANIGYAQNIKQPVKFKFIGSDIEVAMNILKDANVTFSLRYTTFVIEPKALYAEPMPPIEDYKDEIVGPEETTVV